MHQNHCFNRCTSCGQGELIVVQEIDSKKYLVMCDDCQSIWDYPNSNPEDTDCIGLLNTIVRDATQEEIRDLGWTRFYKENI